LRIRAVLSLRAIATPFFLSPACRRERISVADKTIQRVSLRIVHDGVPWRERARVANDKSTQANTRQLFRPFSRYARNPYPRIRLARITLKVLKNPAAKSLIVIVLLLLTLNSPLTVVRGRRTKHKKTDYILWVKTNKRYSEHTYSARRSKIIDPNLSLRHSSLLCLSGSAHLEN
jgi:hypothetical protein